MLSLLLATRAKCSAFQSTTIFRLPTPRKPPKSMTAARPSTPCASLAPMIVTEGGGTASFGPAAGTVFGCGGLRPAGGVSSAAQDVTATNAAKAIARNGNRRFARIWPPEILIDGAWFADGRRAARNQSAHRTLRPSDTNPDRCPKFEFCARRRLADADKCAPRSVSENDGHLNPAARAQDFQRHVIAVAAHPEIDARRTQLQFAQDHLVKESRQARVTQANFAALRVEFETERRFQQRERRRARPSLRRAGDWVQRRSALLFTPEATEQLGKSP